MLQQCTVSISQLTVPKVKEKTYMDFASKSGNPVFLKYHSLHTGWLGSFPAVFRQKWIYTLDKLSVHHGHVLRQTTICTRLRTILDFLELGREPTKTQAEQNPHITEWNQLPYLQFISQWRKRGKGQTRHRHKKSKSTIIGWLFLKEKQRQLPWKICPSIALWEVASEPTVVAGKYCWGNTWAHWALTDVCWWEAEKVFFFLSIFADEILVTYTVSPCLLFPTICSH